MIALQGAQKQFHCYIYINKTLANKNDIVFEWDKTIDRNKKQSTTKIFLTIAMFWKKQSNWM